MMTYATYPLENYVKIETPKKKIVLHGSYSLTTNTKGRDTTIVDSWNQRPRPSKLGTSYLIGRDGTIYDLFPDKYWAWHLNLRDNGTLDKESIGITLANEGPLFPGKFSDKEIAYYAFDSLSSDCIYTGPSFTKEWRGESYWADFDDKQLKALTELVAKICEAHKIKPLFYKNSCAYDQSVWEKATILCHSNINLAVLDFPTNAKLAENLAQAEIPVI